MDRRRRRRAVVLLAGLLALLAAILAYPHRHTITPFFHRQRLALTEFLDARYEAHRQRLLENAVRRQTVDLPTVDRVEVFSFDTPPGCCICSVEPEADPDSGFLVRPADKRLPVFRHAERSGAEAEELARLWRGAAFETGAVSLSHSPAYGIRFYRRGCLVLESSVSWDSLSCHVEDAGVGHAFISVYEEDERLLERLQEIAPLSKPWRAHFLQRRGAYALMKNDLDRAIQLLSEAVRLDPNSAHAYLFRAMTWQELGDADKALEDCERALALDESESIYMARGDCYASQGDFKLAIADYTRVIEMAEQWERLRIEGYMKRGLARLQAGEYQEALADTNWVIDKEPGWDPDSYRQRAKVYEAMGERSSAEADRRVADQIEANRGY